MEWFERTSAATSITLKGPFELEVIRNAGHVQANIVDAPEIWLSAKSTDDLRGFADAITAAADAADAQAAAVADYLGADDERWSA
jgi:hypothetical protein